jgi:alkylated DNA nucleotide flippase Atl1
MANSAVFQRIKGDTLAIVAKVPVGRVTTHPDLGRFLGVPAHYVVTILGALDDHDRDLIPWWRVVADGGAVGRHAQRDEQIARLKLDGITLSPVGIVQDLADRRVKDLASPPPAIVVSPYATSTEKPSRSRGMFGKPSSSL